MSYEGQPPVSVTTVAGGGLLLAADPNRTSVDFALPPSFGLFINPNGAAAVPNQPGTTFYAPGSAYTANDAAAEPAIYYYTTIPGMVIVIQTQG